MLHGTHMELHAILAMYSRIFMRRSNKPTQQMFTFGFLRGIKFVYLEDIPWGCGALMLRRIPSNTLFKCYELSM